jgi:chromosome segregation ATPase
MKPAQTAAAIAARRQQTQDKLRQVEQAIAQLRRERSRLTIRSVADRAGVSATFLYENADARALVQQAATDTKSRRDRAATGTHERIEASWRERALNAEAELGRTQQEVLKQRQRIGELMGQLRDAEQLVPGDSIQAALTENTTLKRRVQQLSQEHRALQERLDGARSNLRFAEKRIADLEAQLLEPEQAMPLATQTNPGGGPHPHPSADHR